MLVRCFLLRQGRVRGVEVLDAVNDDHARELAAELFKAAGPEGRFDGYTLWDRARLLSTVTEADSENTVRELEVA